MPETQNTPPHSSLTIIVGSHGSTIISAEIHGCKECLATAIALLLIQNKDMKELINKSVRIANEHRAQKEN